MVAQGRTYLQTAWWLSFFPGLAIVITTVSATILAAWVRIATDPAQRWRLTRAAQDPPPAGQGGQDDRSDVMTTTSQETTGTSDDHVRRRGRAREIALDVDGLSVDIRTPHGTVRAVDGVASRPVAARPWPCSASPAAASR